MELKVGNYVLTKSYGLGIVSDLSSSSLVSISYGRGVERNFLYEKNKRSDVIFYVSSDFIHAWKMIIIIMTMVILLGIKQ